MRPPSGRGSDTTGHRGPAAPGGLPGPEEPRPWHALSPDAVLHLTGTGAGGLDRREAERRLELYGPNELPPRRGRGPVLRFLAQFHNTLIYFLLAACAATWLVGHTADAVVILAVVLVNAVVGFVQEGRAEHALNAIRAMISPRAGVLRGGRAPARPCPSWSSVTSWC
ncbi:cation-transporting P-type ATPase [Nocardiopsis composta]